MCAEYLRPWSGVWTSKNWSKISRAACAIWAWKDETWNKDWHWWSSNPSTYAKSTCLIHDKENTPQETSPYMLATTCQRGGNGFPSGHLLHQLLGLIDDRGVRHLHCSAAAAAAVRKGQKITSNKKMTSTWKSKIDPPKVALSVTKH